MPKPAAGPPRYVVDRIGTPDPPDTEYWVLDLVHSHEDRVALASVGRMHRQANRVQLSEACFAALDATNAASHAHFAHLNSLRARDKKKQKPVGS